MDEQMNRQAVVMIGRNGEIDEKDLSYVPRKYHALIRETVANHDYTHDNMHYILIEWFRTPDLAPRVIFLRFAGLPSLSEG